LSGGGETVGHNKERLGNMKSTKTNKAKTIITTIVGVPAGLIMISETDNITGVWLQLGAVVAVFGLMAWHGLLKREHYDADGYVIER
jgi:hypothetical protein